MIGAIVSGLISRIVLREYLLLKTQLLKGEKMAETSGYTGEKRGAAPRHSVSKCIELTGESEKGWDEAVRVCVAEAAQTLQNISDVEVEEMRGTIRDGAIASYQVRCRISFRIDDRLRGH